MDEKKVGEKLSSVDDILYHIDEMKVLFTGLGRLHLILNSMAEVAKEVLSDVYPEKGMVEIAALDAAVTSGLKNLKEVALELEVAATRKQNDGGETDDSQEVSGQVGDIRHDPPSPRKSKKRKPPARPGGPEKQREKKPDIPGGLGK